MADTATTEVPAESTGRTIVVEAVEQPKLHTISDRLGDLRARVAAGEDLATVALETTTTSPDPVPEGPIAPPATPNPVPPSLAQNTAAPTTPPADPVETPAPNDPELEVPADQSVEETLRQIAENMATDDDNSLPGDPEGTYRDEGNRLRDKVTHAFRKAPAADPAAEPVAAADPAAPEATPAAPEGEVDPALVVELRARHDGDEPVQYVAESPEQAELLRANIRDGLRRNEFSNAMATVERDRADYDHILSQIKEAPADFILSKIEDGTRVELTTALLASLPEEQFAQIVARATEWETSPSERVAHATHHENQRLQRELKAERTRQATQASRDHANALAGELIQLIPETMDPARQDRVYRVLAGELRAYQQTHKLRSIHPSQVRPALEASGVLQDLGLNGTTASSPAPVTTSSAAPVARPTAPSGPVAPPAAPPEAKVVGEALAARAASRRAASSVAPGGGGAPATRMQKPEGMTLSESLDWARKVFKR